MYMYICVCIYINTCNCKYNYNSNIYIDNIVSSKPFLRCFRGLQDCSLLGHYLMLGITLENKYSFSCFLKTRMVLVS